MADYTRFEDLSVWTVYIGFKDLSLWTDKTEAENLS